MGSEEPRKALSCMVNKVCFVRIGPIMGCDRRRRKMGKMVVGKSIGRVIRLEPSAEDAN